MWLIRIAPFTYGTFFVIESVFAYLWRCHSRLTAAYSARLIGSSLVPARQDLGHAAVGDSLTSAYLARSDADLRQVDDSLPLHRWEWPAVHEITAQLVDLSEWLLSFYHLLACCCCCGCMMSQVVVKYGVWTLTCHLNLLQLPIGFIWRFALENTFTIPISSLFALLSSRLVSLPISISRYFAQFVSDLDPVLRLVAHK